MKIAVSVVVTACVRCQRGASPAIAAAADTLTQTCCQGMASPAVAVAAHSLPGRGSNEGVSPGGWCAVKNTLEWAKEPVVWPVVTSLTHN